jgi:hypothetical protein
LTQCFSSSPSPRKWSWSGNCDDICGACSQCGETLVAEGWNEVPRRRRGLYNMCQNESQSIVTVNSNNIRKRYHPLVAAFSPILANKLTRFTASTCCRCVCCTCYLLRSFGVCRNRWCASDLYIPWSIMVKLTTRTSRSIINHQLFRSSSRKHLKIQLKIHFIMFRVPCGRAPPPFILRFDQRVYFFQGIHPIIRKRHLSYSYT